MVEYTVLRYREIKVLLELDHSVEFHPYREASVQLNHYPEYIEGVLSPAGNRVSLLVDLGRMLSLHPEEGVPEIILEINKRENISLKVPLPEVIDLDIPHKDLFRGHLPSAEYYDVDGVTYLVIQLKNLYKTIRSDLEDVHIQLPELEYTGLLDETSTFRSPPSIEVHTEGASQEAVLMILGDLRILIDRDFVREILQSLPTSIPHPSRKEWIRGLYKFEDDSILAIDSVHYFGVTGQTLMDVVIEKGDSIFMMDAETIENVDMADFEQILLGDYTGDYLFDNMYYDKKGIVYHLNVDSVISDIISLERKMFTLDSIREFFSRERRERDLELDELQSSEEMNYMNLMVDDVNCFVSNMTIEQIGKPEDYPDLPKITLGEVLKRDSNPQYAVVTDVGTGHVALLCDEITTTPSLRTHVEEKIFAKMNPVLNELGFSEMVEDGKHVGINFDPIQMSKGLGTKAGKLNKEGIEIKVGESNYGIWFTDYVTLLRVQISNNTYRYFSTEGVEEFLTKADSPKNPLALSERMVYVKYKGEEYAIPRGSTLVNVQRDLMDGDGFVLDGEHVKIEEIGEL